MQSPWRRLCLWSYRIVNNTENRFSGAGCFWINNLNDRPFLCIWKQRFIPLSRVEEMGNCSSVAGTVFSKIRGFSMVSRKMLIRILIRWLIIRLEYDLHKSNFLNWLYMNAEWCIVFAGDTFFRECCKCWFGHFHYTTQSNSRCLSFMQNHELAHL